MKLDKTMILLASSISACIACALTYMYWQDSIKNGAPAICENDCPLPPANGISSAKLDPLQIPQKKENALIDRAYFDAMGKSSSLSSFIESAKHHPENGGIYWAIIATDICRKNQFLQRMNFDVRPINPADSQYARRASSLQKIGTYCNNVDLTDEARVALKSMGEQLNDPLVKKQIEVEAALNIGDRGKALSILFQQMGPDVASLAIESLLQHKDDSVLGGSIYFEGRWLDQADGTNLQIAAALVPCDFGYECGSDRLELAVSCARFGKCYGSVEEMLKSQSNIGTRVDWEKVTSFRAAIGAAIKNSNASALYGAQ